MQRKMEELIVAHNDIFVVEHNSINSCTSAGLRKSFDADDNIFAKNETSSLQEHEGNDKSRKQNDILRSGSVLVRGRFRRVWRERYIELMKDGILKYYSTSVDSQQNTINSSAVPSGVGQRNPSVVVGQPSEQSSNIGDSCSSQEGHISSTAVGNEWCDVLQACYPGGDATSAGNSSGSSTSSSEQTTETSSSSDASSESEVAPAVSEDDKNKPRAILLVLRARLLDPSTFKDARSGVPLDKWGFLFHGHILYYEDHMLGGNSNSNINDPAQIISDVDMEHGVLEGQANMGNVLYNPFSSRAFHVAVDTQNDAIEWVRTLQSVALSTTCGLTSEMPSRYAIIDETCLQSQNTNKTYHHQQQQQQRSDTSNKTRKDREKWATSLFDPLKISLSSQSFHEEEEETKKENKCITSDSKINSDGNDNNATTTSGNDASDKPSPKSSSNTHSVFNRLMKFGIETMTGSFRRANSFLDDLQNKCHITDRCTYWCVLGLAVSFSSYLGAILIERSSSSSSRFFPPGGGNQRDLTSFLSSSGSSNGSKITSLLGPSTTTLQIRIDHAALGLAAAFAFGYKLGSNGSTTTTEVTSNTSATTKNKMKQKSASVKTATSCTVMEDNKPSSELISEPDQKVPHASKKKEVVLLSSPLPKYTGDGSVVTSCWSEPSCDMFKVRGESYLKDRKKVPSQPAIFECQGVDVWLTDEPRSNIVRHPAVQGGKLSKRLKDPATYGSNKGIFVLNFLLPFGNFVAVFDVPCEDTMPLHVQNVWKKFVSGDQSYRDARLKLLPIVVDGPWVVKTVVGNGSSPALLGKAVPLQYHFTTRSSKDEANNDNHQIGIYEVDVIISASNIARGILNVVKGHTKYLTIAFALIIEATDETELPENILCTFGVHSIDLDQCPSLDDFENSLREED